MNRIICDICGSEYAETEERCPICGYARQGTEKVVAASAADGAVTKVKGGRFSSKNVKKRRKAQQRSEAEGREKNPNRPLWIIIALLLSAIVLVSVYIGFRFFQSRNEIRDILPGATTTAAPTETTTVPTVPCAAISLDSTVIALDNAGQTQQLSLKLMPEGTTDVPVFHTSDPAVVTVSESGLLTAVGSGQAVVTITCGDAERTCEVLCWFQTETTAPPTQPAETAAPTEAPEPTEAPVLVLDPNDASCFEAGESFTIYAKLGSKSVGRSKIKWSTSDAKVAKVDNGVVTAVGKGTASITAEYEGQKAVCMVRCRFENPAPTEEDRQEQEDQQDQEKPAWKASHTDVSIGVGESFRLTVKNADGETAKAIWTMSIDGVVSIEGRTITGRSPGTVTLTTTVDGVTMTCIVRVK